MSDPGESPSTVADLTDLNVRIGKAEAAGGEGRQELEALLDGELRFRRGDGSVVDCGHYLEGLDDPGNRTDLLTTEVVQVQVLRDQAFVECLVRFKGIRGGNPAEGVFRNLRLFERQPRGWRCVLWFNKKIGELDGRK